MGPLSLDDKVSAASAAVGPLGPAGIAPAPPPPCGDSGNIVPSCEVVTVQLGCSCDENTLIGRECRGTCGYAAMPPSPRPHARDTHTWFNAMVMNRKS